MFYLALSHQTATTFVQRDARNRFERLHHQGLRRQIWLRLTGRRRRLLNLSEVQKHITVHTRYHAGVRLVLINRICGSENRCGDFDADFRLLKSHSHPRWTSIALARQQDIALPLVELVQIDDLYFVRDGHHRISVARALGQREIEAEVTVWQCRNVNKAASVPVGVSPGKPVKRRQPNLGQRLLWRLGKQLITAGNKLQAFCPPEPNIVAIQGS
jgi:hypothetical protein